MVPKYLKPEVSPPVSSQFLAVLLYAKAEAIYEEYKCVRIKKGES